MIRKFAVVMVFLLIAGIGNLAAQRPDFAADHYFVGFNSVPTAADLGFLRGQGVQLGKSFSQAQTIEIVTRNPIALAAIQRSARVDFVEAVPMRYATSLSTAQLAPSASNGLYGLVKIKAVDVHNMGFTGANVDVGLADTAIDCNHPDIAANLGTRYFDAVGDGSHGACWLPGDVDETHATHVAGTILGVNNTVGIYGVAYNARLHHARVLGPQGGTSAEVMAGVQWLVETEHVRVVNLSLGGGFPSLSEERFFRSMRNQGALIVAAAGNSGKTRLSYPAAYAVNIAVGAVDRNNVIADFSQTGRNLDVVAPGVGVLSSVPNGTGSEASVTTTSTFTAFGMEFAGKTAGITKPLFSCGLAVAATDCPAGVAGNIALIQRGTNSFAEKVANAMTAGAAAVIVYNNAPGDFIGTLGTETNGATPWIPALSVSDVIGATLAGQLGTSTNVKNIASSWDTYDGTSMATPHVTGTIALMWGAAPAKRNSQIESDLFTTCTDLGPAGYDTTFGNGLINALSAVKKAAGIQ